MKDICGRSSDASLRSQNLQNCLASRLVQRLDGVGSLEYELTWKHWDMESGPRILARRASGRHISGNGCGGWPTTSARDWKNGKASQATLDRNARPLSEVAMLAGWATPSALAESRGGLQSNPEKALERKEQGHQLNLDDRAVLAGRSSPRANKRGFPDAHGSHEAPVAGWVSPTVMDANRGVKPPRSRDTGVPVVAAGSTVWDDYYFIPCLDGKLRRVESGLLPLAHGVPARMGRLRGYGNAIVSQVAAEFIRAYLDCRP
jgi:hypothetical protein